MRDFLDLLTIEKAVSITQVFDNRFGELWDRFLLKQLFVVELV